MELAVNLRNKTGPSLNGQISLSVRPGSASMSAVNSRSMCRWVDWRHVFASMCCLLNKTHFGSNIHLRWKHYQKQKFSNSTAVRRIHIYKYCTVVIADPNKEVTCLCLNPPLEISLILIISKRYSSFNFFSQLSHCSGNFWLF